MLKNNIPSGTKQFQRKLIVRPFGNESLVSHSSSITLYNHKRPRRNSVASTSTSHHQNDRYPRNVSSFSFPLAALFPAPPVKFARTSFGLREKNIWLVIARNVLCRFSNKRNVLLCKVGSTRVWELSQTGTKRQPGNKTGRSDPFEAGSINCIKQLYAFDKLRWNSTKLWR